MAKAPACSRCAWTLQGLRFLSLVVLLAIAFASLYFVWPYFKDSVPRIFHKWAMLILAIVCALPHFIFEIYFARPFDITAFADSVDYEFTSMDYAIDFATLNHDADWVKVNGEIVNR